MVKVSTSELKNNLGKYIRAIEAGEVVFITRHGKCVAQITQSTIDRKKEAFDRLSGSLKNLAETDAETIRAERLSEKYDTG